MTKEWVEGRKGGKLVTNRHARIQDFFENFWGNPFYFNMGHFWGGRKTTLTLPPTSKSAPDKVLFDRGRSIHFFYAFLFQREELNNANASNTEFLFGLFADDEMSYRWHFLFI